MSDTASSAPLSTGPIVYCGSTTISATENILVDLRVNHGAHTNPLIAKEQERRDQQQVDLSGKISGATLFKSKHSITEPDLCSDFDTLDEPVWDTIRRDLRTIGTKFGQVLAPKNSQQLLRDWDLWGPLFICVFISLLLQGGKNGKGPHFTEVFTLTFFGSCIVTLNTKLLGGNISFFQSLCVLGYCLLPPGLAAVVCKFIEINSEQTVFLFALRLLVTVVGFTWAIYVLEISAFFSIYGVYFWFAATPTEVARTVPYFFILFRHELYMEVMEVIPFSSQSEAKDQSDEGRSDICIHGAPIPPQILTEILIRVDNPHDIGYVCRRWRSVLSAPGFWVNYMMYRSLDLPPSSLRSEPSLNVKKVSIKRTFNRNLVRNPSGGDGSLQNWEVGENGGDGFVIEKPPKGCADSSIDIPIAFATSYGWCSKFQIIDLWKEGIEPAFLDEFCPPITVSEYCTCRFDCTSIYLLEVQLLYNDHHVHDQVDDGSMPLAFRSIPGILVCAQYRRLGRQRVMPRHDETTDTSIIRVRFLRETGWQKIEHTFSDYPKGIRYVLFKHSGKDEQFWAGHYGSKMANASVVINYGNGERKSVQSR
uniref:FBA domain-containing protein n=1 Tax=Setaria digitata TaxID=48799 RepID=A0A915PF04_9BILA